MKVIITLLFVSYLSSTTAQNSFFVTPYSTHSNYDINQDSSLVSIPNTNQNSKLVLFLGGTNSNTNNYFALRTKVVDLGYTFINLSYPNTIPAASLSSSTNILAFDEYRQELCYGTPISAAVSVDSLNSIKTRFYNLLTYLNTNYPTQNWDDYLISNTSINWTNIIVAGHSQGAGHAAYLAKSNSVERVLMFSGLNDYSDHFSSPGNWLSTTSLTPFYKYYTYLSLLDEIVDYNKQYLNVLSVGVTGDSTHVENQDYPFNNSHNLYTTQAPGLSILNHSSPIKFSIKNNEVWTYMLTSDLTNNLSQHSMVRMNVYPNPSSDILHIDHDSKLSNNIYSILSINGNLVKTGTFKNYEIEIGNLTSGSYILIINNTLRTQFVVR